jgi:hypothetical protein
VNVFTHRHLILIKPAESVFVGMPNAKQKQSDIPSERYRRRRMTGGFFDQKYDSALVAFRDLDPVTGLADQIGNVDHRQRIGTMYLQEVAQPKSLERLSRLQRRERTFKSRQVKLCRGHVPNMAKGSGIVN